jgi:curved DNA-binding protein CbpA
VTRACQTKLTNPAVFPLQLHPDKATNTAGELAGSQDIKNAKDYTLTSKDTGVDNVKLLQKVMEAWDTLKTPESRAQYDADVEGKALIPFFTDRPRAFFNFKCIYSHRPSIEGCYS